MKKLRYILVSCLLVFSCEAQEIPTVFSSEALEDTFITLDEESIAFKEILEKYKGKTILIDVWASWCADCIKGMPKIKKIKRKHKDVVFVFLSLDKDVNRWKKGIDKYRIEGEHYFMQSGWDGVFGDFLDLDWIPRYMVIDKDGKIKLFKAVKATDDEIIKALQ